MLKLRNRKHFPCFHRFLETQMEFRENKSSPKLNTSVFGIYPLYKLDLSRPDMSNVFSKFPHYIDNEAKRAAIF